MFSDEGRPGEQSPVEIVGDGFADDALDAADAEYFTNELEGVDASDWNVDATLIWGDDHGDAFDDTGADAFGPDFLV